ncbi:restriction endonuclease subunit S, partial [Lactobacillus salivarius]|nr:restriction endonuclease subunit S [Ligilactobacillus salivarius]
MAKEEKKAPKLRFNGYTNDWEQVKLGDVAEITPGGTPSK